MHISFGAIDHIDRQDRPVHETYDSRLKLLQLYDRAGFSTFHVTETTAWAATQNMNICFLAPTARTRVLVDAYKTAWTKQFGGGQAMPKVGLTRHIYVGETDAQAMERGLFGYKGWFEKYSYLWAKHDPRPPGPFDPEHHRKGGRFIFGSPATVRAELEREFAETGVNYFAARFAYGDLSHEESVRSLELFTREVMPSFQERTIAA